MSIWKARKKYLLEQLKPKLNELGFEVVGTDIKDSRTTATHVQFERQQNETYDGLTIIFDKYWRPKFQIIFSRRDIAPPHKFIRSGHLVRRRGQITCWWGIRWFSLNKEKAWRKSIDKVSCRLRQIDVFLETASDGKNITDMAKYF